MDNSQYYEFFQWEDVTASGHDEMLKAIFNIIPEGTRSILDVGCGNGIMTNELAKKFDVTGVDRSEKALSYLRCNKIQASCDHIPLDNASFDMVISTELLEHLETEVLMKTVEEFKRISKKHILITVPHDENIQKMLIKCPECGYVYNRVYHLRKFDRKSLEDLFTGYRSVRHSVLGKPVRTYNMTLTRLKKRFTPPSSWIPPFWIAKDKRKTMCPRCEHTFDHTYRFNLLALLLDLTNIVISRKKPYWQMALFEKVTVK